MVAPLLLLAGAQAVGSVVSGIANSKNFKAQRDIANMGADAAARQGELDESRLRQRQRAGQGTARASIAANGLVLDGSALDLMENNAVQNEMDALLTRYAGKVKAWGLRNEANALDSQADNAVTAGFFQAGASLAKSYSSGYTSDNTSLGSGWYGTQGGADAAAAKAGITWNGAS